MQNITEMSKRKIKALDTIYITDLMIDSVLKICGYDYFKSNSYYKILIEQFYLNQKRLLRLPKYVQSKIGDGYKQAKKYLLAGRTVLFSGTPCQIDGLYAS